MPKKMTIQKVYPPGQPFEVEYNPEEFTLNKDNSFAAQEIPGLSKPLLQYVHGNVATLEMELFFDTYDKPGVKKDDVRTLTRQVTDLLNIESETHAPPILELSWGTVLFKCVLNRVSQRFILFMQDGTPVRARLNVSFQEYADPETQALADNKQTADFTKSHTLIPGQTLDSLASTYYQDPTLWRPIAVANSIDDPSRLDGIDRLLIPSLPYRDPESGEVVR